MKKFGKMVVAFAATAAAALSLNTAQAADPYKIGYVTDLSGPFRDAYTPVLEGFQLYMKQLNDKGGIAGHPVNTIVRDDQLNASRSASMSIDLINGEGVSSLWGLSLSSTLSAVYQVAARQQVPAIANFSGIKSVLAPAAPYAYSIGHVFEVAGEVSGKMAANLAGNKGKVVCVSVDSAGGIAGCNHTQAAAKATGMEVDRVLFPPPTAEFSAIGQSVVAKNPTVVVTHLGAAQVVGVLRAIRGAGYKGSLLIGAHGVPESDVIKAMKAAGHEANTYIFSRFALRDSEGEEMNQLKAAATKYGIKTELSNSHIMGWALAKVAEDSLRKCGFPCSGPALNKVLESTTIDPGSLMGSKIEFTTKNHYGPSTWRLYQYQPASGKFAASTGWIKAPPELAY
jgi:branched-chain amino acid transport system substrate-binding protein